MTSHTYALSLVPCCHKTPYLPSLRDVIYECSQTSLATISSILKFGSKDEDQENSYGRTIASGLEDEVGYGKSPEWVEVDGHIVSKGVASLGRSELGPDPRSGSVLSLPYSSRTQLTYNR